MDPVSAVVIIGNRGDRCLSIGVLTVGLVALLQSVLFSYAVLAIDDLLNRSRCHDPFLVVQEKCLGYFHLYHEHTLVNATRQLA